MSRALAMLAVSFRAATAALLGLCCSGCATIGLWEATERTTVEIRDVRVVETNGIAQAVVVIGRERPFLWFSTEGEVDSFDVFAQAGKRQTCVISTDCPTVTNATCRLPMVYWERESASDFRCPEGVFVIWNQTHMRASIAVPVASAVGSPASGLRREGVMVLDGPRIWRNREDSPETLCYTRKELGVRGVSLRVLLVPVTVCADIVTLPVALLVGPFMKMCN